MALTQEAILNTLLEGKGKVKNSELLSKFKEPLNCSDPAEKKQNRDLFKTFVNNIAVVKDFQDAKYIVLKKVYHHLLEASNDENAPREDCGRDGSHPEEDEKEKSTHSQNAEGKKSEQKALSRSSSKASDGSTELSPIEIALERSKNVDFKPKRSLHFTVPLKPDPDFSGAAKKEASTNKPYALPLRMPQIDLGHHHKKPSTESLGQELQPSPRCTDSVACAGASPQLQRHFKTPKQADEPKDSHHCPLDPVEHEWLVKSAAGQWNQVYGLLLKDAQLAEKKDFMSGFTALHWAVKCGDADMVCRIIEVSRKSDHGVDVNGKSNGGYTPLHIAAIHLQLSLIDLLVRKYGANGNIRDNCGKKPYHYLDKGVSRELRELLGDPKAGHREVHHQVREEYDARKYSIGHLVLAHPVGLKKKNKARNQFVSVNDDGRERDEPVLHKLRLVSDVFP
ncbi:ankyrin repeat domain-containing protein SOWAHA-like [Sinocyclocheilus anshuiensis]|uniref:ankyrin repeat domain-containing protein SOWAHA-like n=1 Tax=Sinocyclocheilus anshuiensis TaxID=1608454 RepID=UPI0007B9AF91|nr:PREDICTED: ankyrin repeat domain-containing protein SOWAHA-like [Sinocyclocheilus anshuiensis]